MPMRSRMDRLQKPVFVASAADEMEAGVITSILASCGIVTQQRNQGIGAYMGVVLGSNRYGIDIYVDEDDLESARAVLDAKPVGEDLPPEEDVMEEVPAEADVSASPWFFLLLLLVPVLFALLFRLLDVRF